jgi:hypothetical protein
MFVIAYTIGERQPRTNRLAVEPAGEINPLAAVVTPRLTAKSLHDAGGKKLLLKRR